MMMHRTDLAAQALHIRCKTLSAMDRQILILANGRHSQADLLRMMGAGAQAQQRLQLLAQRGFLRVGALAVKAPSPVPVAEPPKPIKPPATQGKRSLAAAKMYMLDMVQRSRNASSQPVQEAIKTAGDAQQMRAAFDAALAYLQQQGGAGYAEKIAAQLAALLPLEG
jgi:hypothetical protein